MKLHSKRSRVAYAAIATIGIAACVQEPAPSEPGEKVAEQEPLSAGEGDDVSPQPVQLRWVSALDGAEPLTQLVFDLENTTDEPIEADLRIASRDGRIYQQLEPRALQLPARSTTRQQVDVAELPVQRIGAPVAAEIDVVYPDRSGVTSVSWLEPVFARHEGDYASAYVRNSTAEEQVNRDLVRERGTEAMFRMDDVRGRMLDDASGEFIDEPLFADEDGGSGRMLRVAHIPELFAGSGFEDPQLPQETGAVEKSGTFKVCFELPYRFADAGLGEDWLNFSPLVESYEPARFAQAALLDDRSATAWSGYLDGNGCTPATAHPRVHYTGIVATALRVPVVSVEVDIRDAEIGPVTMISMGYTASGGTATQKLRITSSWPVGNATVAMTSAMYWNLSAFAPETLSIATGPYCEVPWTDDNGVARIENAGCYKANLVKLGTSASGVVRADRKFIVLHETGHYIQENLFGALAANYQNDRNPNTKKVIEGQGGDSTNPICRCDHVTSSNPLHCLQSRERIGAAMHEGWGHFFASTTLNIPSETNCTFTYYKEFKNADGTMGFPPLAKSCYFPVKWRKSNCFDPASVATGTEYDWLGFYWTLKNKNSIGWDNFRSVYKKVCGDKLCNGNSITWSQLNSAATTVFGSGSTKALAWKNTGANFGVD